MSELCFIASHGYPTPTATVLHHHQNLSRSFKDSQPLLSICGARPDNMIRSGILNIQPPQSVEPLKSIIGLSESNQFVEFDPKATCLEMVNSQENLSGSLIFSFGFDEQFQRYEKVSEPVMSCSTEDYRHVLDLSDLTGLQALNTQWCQDQDSFTSSLIFPSCEFVAQKPFMDFVGDLVRSSKITIHPDGHAMLTATGKEIKDLLSIVAEFHLSKNSLNWGKKSILVPSYERLNGSGVASHIYGSSVKLHATTFAPFKSPDTIKIKPSLKRRNSKKAVHERDLYKKNYFHACENLMSFMFNKKRQRKRAILSLKNSGPELPELLTQFSAGIAGTGLAVLFSVMCKVACGRVPFCSSKLLNTGFGFCLLWLSCAVNKLRDTVVYISKKAGLKEDEMMTRVDKSINEIFFSAATLMTVAILRIG